MVVISIIGMLMALLLPAVQGARETGRRNTCMSNQKNVGFALQQYNDTKKSFPGWNNWLSASANTTNLSGNLQYGEVTYIVPLLPFLERTDVYSAYSQYLNTLLSGSSSSGNSSNQLLALGSAQVYMALLVCPSNPPITQSGATPLAYVINGGEVDDSTSTAVPVTQSTALLGQTSPSTTLIQSVAASAGIAYDQTGITNAAGVPVVKVSQDYVNSHDGTAYTLLLSENTLALSSWSLLANGTTGPSVNAGYGAALSASAKGPAQQYATTFMWTNNSASGSSTPPAGFYPINGDKSNTVPTAPTGYTTLSYARPASNHNGVCVFTFCGGNVKPIAEDINYRVYKQLMTPFGGTTNSTTGISGSGDPDSMTTLVDDTTF
jgi:type II secretory pathway pseudopilin PulG